MQLHRALVFALVIPGALAVLVTGIDQAYLANVSLLAEWMLGSFVVWGVALAIDKAISEATRLVDAGAVENSAELRRHVTAPRIVVGEWSQQILIVIFLYLMVFRPGD